jgi:predicted TIM-barrel fold metal-dependent hydrolase
MLKIDRRSFIKVAGKGAAALWLASPLKALAGEGAANEGVRIISVEEHFSTPEHLDLIRAILEKRYSDPAVLAEEEYISSDAPFIPMMDNPQTRDMVDRLMDTGEGRLQIMDRFGIDMQVLSLVSPGVQVLDADGGVKLSKEMNDRLAKIVREHPSRFAGLACLAPQSPEEAADELERAVTDLGLKGACINSHTKGEYLDEKKFRVIFQRAEKLNVPIYLHPRAPSADMIKPHLDYPLLDSAMWGFGSETGLHAMRLICSGIFDEHEKLRIVLGHLGEAIPFWMWRIENFWGKTPLSKSLQKTPSQYFKDNFAVSTSGMFSGPALEYVMKVVGAENIMFAVDYPFESPETAVTFITDFQMSARDRENICHMNAERIFSL